MDTCFYAKDERVIVYTPSGLRIGTATGEQRFGQYGVVIDGDLYERVMYFAPGQVTSLFSTATA